MKRLIYLIFLALVISGCGGGTTTGQSADEAKNPPVEDPADEDTAETPPDEKPPDETPPDTGTCDNGAAPSTYYQDVDGDSYGSASVTTQACSAPPGYVTNNTDCNDTNANIKPGVAEVCDGLDNDCDNVIDNNISPISSTCGIGECVSAGQKTCVDGKIVDNCQPKPVTNEICDGLDNDCDGTIDEGVTNACGGCGTLSNTKDSPCDGVDADSCNEGTWTCSTDKKSVYCNDPNDVDVEICDGIDNDCDGSIDEGVTNACGGCGTLSHPKDSVCDGVDADSCNEGIWTCSADKKSVYCNDPNDVDAEICDGLDNDCNGVVDDNISPIPSTCGIGECVSSGQKTCVGGKIVDSCQPDPATDEICDGKDNDCDGNIEESKDCGCLGFLDTYLAYPTLNDFPYDTTPDAEHIFSNPGREPSGAVYIPIYDSIFMVGDGGHIVRLSTDLAVLTDWSNIGGDLEGITYDPNTNKIYVIVEGSQVVREYTYTPADGTLTLGRSWNVSSIIVYNNDNSGIEAVTFVPTTDSAQGGVFYIGNQHDGKIYIVEIDLLDNAPAYDSRLFPNAPQNINIVNPPPGITRDISDLYYESVSGLVYAIWDGDNKMGALDTKTNEYVLFFNLPSAQPPAGNTITENEEGITFDDSCRLFIGQDVISGQAYGSMKRFDP